MVHGGLFKFFLFAMFYSFIVLFLGYVTILKKISAVNLMHFRKIHIEAISIFERDTYIFLKKLRQCL